MTLKLLRLASACALLSLVLALFFGFCFEPSSMGIRSEDIALFSGSMSSGFVFVSVFSGTVRCWSGAAFNSFSLDRRSRRRDFFPLPFNCFGCWACCGCCCRDTLFCCGLGKDCLFICDETICCCPVAATAAALAATLDGFCGDATSFSSESDVESESDSDEEACLNLWTNLSSPVSAIQWVSIEFA